MIESMELSVVREALQARILVELMGNAMHKELVLKGGLAMRAVHGSTRFTKDIDLDADHKFSKERISGIVRRSIQRSMSAGLIDNAVVTEPKHTDTTLRWKIVGNQPGSNAPMNLTVEVSRRAALTHGHVIEVELPAAFGSGAAGVTVQVLDSQAIAVTKILALTDPKRMAPRDLYDLHILIDAQISDPTDLLARLPDAERVLRQSLEELWPKIEAMSFEQFNTDVIPFLPGAVASAIDQDAFDDMRLKVGSRVEKWLSAAADAIKPPSLAPRLLSGTPLAPVPAAAASEKSSSKPKMS